MSALNLTKHAVKFLWAIDRTVKTEVQKTEEEYIRLAEGVLRPVLRELFRKYNGEPFFGKPKPLEGEDLLPLDGIVKGLEAVTGGESAPATDDQPDFLSPDGEEEEEDDAPDEPPPEQDDGIAVAPDDEDIPDFL